MLEILDPVREAIEGHKMTSVVALCIVAALISGIGVSAFAAGGTYTTTKTVGHTVTVQGQPFLVTTYTYTTTTVTKNETWTYTWTVITTTQTFTETVNPTSTITGTSTITQTVTYATYVNYTIT